MKTRRSVLPIVWVLVLLLTLSACGQQEAPQVYGECILPGEAEDITQDTFTPYLQEAYGLSGLLSHKVYYGSGIFQTDFQFSSDAPQWQMGSAVNFSVEKFYFRITAQYDIREYDIWLMDRLGENTQTVIYRIFVEDTLKAQGQFPFEMVETETA